jgi:hypothetical protein
LHHADCELRLLDFPKNIEIIMVSDFEVSVTENRLNSGDREGATDLHGQRLRRLDTIEKQKTAANGRRRNANENFKMIAFVNE